MLVTKHSTKIIKSKGSKALKDRLLTGDIQAIAKQFNLAYPVVYNVLSGKYYGDAKIVECAERIVAYYEQVDLVNQVSKIITSYERAN